MKFLHISDIHLGCERYSIENAEKDFFDAFNDLIQRYALGGKVDFIIIAGDFFHKQQLSPQTLNYAYAALEQIRKEKIPVVVVEGNHDKRLSNQKFSWLQLLANWKFIYFLQPTIKHHENEKEIIYEKWDEQKARGGYVDIGKARIFGSLWHGASINLVTPMLIEGIRKARRDGAFHILLLHTDIEGQEKNFSTALSRANLNMLREVIDYLALGHIHKSYEEGNWIFNPGSLEPTSIDEAGEKRGAWLIEVDDKNNIISKTFISEYKKRAFERIEIKVSDCVAPENVHEMIEKILESRDYSETIVEISLTGLLRFSSSSLDLRKIRDKVYELTNAYHVKIRNKTISDSMDSLELGERKNSSEIEERVIRKLILADSRFRKDEDTIKRMISATLTSKNMVLDEESPENILNFLEAQLFN
jgi:DNA repair exonuclease SbcCD nuclease subunit